MWFYPIFYDGVSQSTLFQIHEELDQVVDENHGEISLDLRAKCPYVKATIMEVQRFAAIKPIALLHATTTDVNFRGYQIAKGTDVSQ